MVHYLNVAKLFRREYDHWRSAMVNEPRGSDVMVGP